MSFHMEVISVCLCVHACVCCVCVFMRACACMFVCIYMCEAAAKWIEHNLVNEKFQVQ